MPATPKPDLRLGRDRILRRRADFAAIKHKGRRLRGPFLTLNWQTNWPEGTMAAFIVPKAVGGSVIRNRIRRRLREIYRHLRACLPPGSATIWIAGPPAATATFPDLAQDLVRLSRKAGLLPQGNPFPPSARTRWHLPDF